MIMKKTFLLSVGIGTFSQILAMPVVSNRLPELSQLDKDSPLYTILGKDTACQVFVYSPAPDKGLRLAYLNDQEQWKDVGQLCASDYGPWGKDKKMYSPFVAKAKDGTWRAVWSVNDHAPVFAAAYSEDLVVWRPQDYPIVKERGVKSPVAYQMGDGTFDIYLKTSRGKRYVQASEDFRVFKEDSLEATADEILWQNDTATIGGKCYQGNEFEISAFHLNYIRRWFAALDQLNHANSLPLPKAPAAPVSAVLNIDAGKTHRISDKLFGVFFEDISRAADGGLWAEMLQNGDFEYDKEDKKKQWNATTAWKGVSLVKPSDAQAANGAYIASANGVSKQNPHYVVMGVTPIYNIGWEGLPVKPYFASEDVRRNAKPAFCLSLYARNMGEKKKQLSAVLMDKDGMVVAEGKLKVESSDWQAYKTDLVFNKKYKGLYEDVVFGLVPKGDSEVAIDMVSLMPTETYKNHGLRKDLAETIASLRPKFVRFPGGCMLHGQGIGNIYHWKETIGAPQDRKPAYNLWGYHQSRRLGFYEYFQWCEDMGAEPLPVVAAGVPCQNSVEDERGIGGQQGGIPMSQMPQYVQDVLDLVEWANGDPAKSKWAKMRAEAGHPASFNLKMIGVGNEDLISTVFRDRYLMICKAVKQRYPNIEVIGTVGPFHWPSADYIEGWKIARDNKSVIDAVDEHYYEQPGWFVNNQDYYDHYDRSQPKVYVGEYASRGKDPLDNALAEGIHLCNLERNGDVVEMASYAPLLSKDGYSNWRPDLIYFNNDSLRTSESYEIQKMFGNHSGDIYIASEMDLPAELRKYVGVSVVKNSKNGHVWLKVVNALPRKLILQLAGLSKRKIEVGARKADVFEL